MTSHAILFHIGLIIFLPLSYHSTKENISQIYNCILIDELYHHTYQNLTAVFVLCKKLKIMGITIGNMLFAYDVIDCQARIKIFWCDNLTGAGHKLVASVHLNYLCWVLKL